MNPGVDACIGRSRASSEEMEPPLPISLGATLTGPVAVLLNETAEVIAVASAAGYRCFASGAAFRAHVEGEILRGEAA